ncbi:MAG TPA: hypothetical protein VKA73_03745 [Rubrobacter sp.]|nr:hypothetical protein [Rubrobacter sp.]
MVSFQISCGHCFVCDRGLQTQCETTQVREEGVDDIMPLLTDGDLLGVKAFQKKQDNAVKVLLAP